VLKTRVKLPQAQTTRGCPRLEEVSAGRMVNSQTKQLFTYASEPCVERGVTVTYDPQAHAEAIEVIKEFLNRAAKVNTAPFKCGGLAEPTHS
jgi:hypothetical protein